MWLEGAFVASLSERVGWLFGFVVVVTLGAAVVTLCSVATFWWMSSPPSVAALCGSCMSILIVASDFIMDFWRRCRLFFGNVMIASLNSPCTALTCYVRLSIGNRQCCGKRLTEPNTLWLPVLGTKNFMLW